MEIEGLIVKNFGIMINNKFIFYSATDGNEIRVTKVMYGGQVVESYSYGAKGRTVTVTDGNGKDYLYNYSEFGRLTTEKNRLGDIKQYFYDTDGALESQNNFDGTTSSIIYNTDRTERRVVYSDGHVNRFIYDAMGNIVLAENEYGTTEYTYDRGGKLVKQSEKNGETVTFSYDASGNRIKLAGAGQETSYRYGKNNELLEVFDRLSRNGVLFTYDKTGKETKRTLNNGNVQYRYYDKAGRIVLLKTESRNRELLFAEGYVYGADGKRSAKVTSNGEVTLYEYDEQGRLSIVWNPATKDMEKLLTEEAEENGLPTLKELKENKYLSGSIQNELSALVYRMNSPARITPMQLFIKEQYSYDGNGNRITKTTAHGTIKYWYDEENRLLATGTNGIQNVTYAYDRNGNLLKKESKLKVITYAYNSENRIVYSEVRDIIKKTRTVTNYAYDAFGRRLIVQDNGGTALRSVYDAFTFDVLKEAPTYENGLFTDTGSAGIKFGRTGKPTGERYRYLDDDHKDGNRYYYLEEDNWKNVSSRYTGIRNVLSANSEVVSQFKEESGSEYFIVDEFGSVKGTSDGYGNLNVTYSYDAFGTLVSDDSSVNYGYAGKFYDTATGLYNFGYRDYLPTAARFTTVDPIRDGSNWFVYCTDDPVNYYDPDGCMPQAIVGGIIGGATGAAANATMQFISNIAHGQKIKEAITNINGKEVLKAAASGAISGAITGGLSSISTIKAVVTTSKAASTILNASGNIIGTITTDVTSNAIEGKKLTDGLVKDISSSIVGGVISGAMTKVGIYCVNDNITYYLTKNGITTAGDTLVNTLVKETAAASIQEFLNYSDGDTDGKKNH